MHLGKVRCFKKRVDGGMSVSQHIVGDGWKGNRAGNPFVVRARDTAMKREGSSTHCTNASFWMALTP